MDKNYRREFAFLLIALAFVVGCGSPTSQIETFIKKAHVALKNDKSLVKEYVFYNDLKYDVKKTNSTVTPYEAQVTFSGLNLPAAADEHLTMMTSVVDGKTDYKAASEALTLLLDGQVDAAGIEKLVQDAGRRMKQRGRATSDDDGVREYHFQCLCKNGKWVLENCAIKMKDGSAPLVPSPIRAHFSP